MLTGLSFVLFGILVLIYPQLLAVLFALFLIVFGTGMMLASWQFRRLKKQTDSRFVNWLIRY
jgi:hypothetical protein